MKMLDLELAWEMITLDTESIVDMEMIWEVMTLKHELERQMKTQKWELKSKPPEKKTQE